MNTFVKIYENSCNHRDVDKLLQTLYKLVERGNTVLMIEHNLDVIRNCQYIVDMGPDGGDKGGEILYQGELKGLQNVSRSHTAKYLQEN